MNWRDSRHPRAGGAELYTQQLAKSLVEAGNEVEWFTAAFPGAKSEEAIDGVRVVRSGKQWTVHIRAFWRYRGRLRERFDLVIDETNTIPFFTPLWADVPVVLLIWQLAREVWWHESPFPLSVLGYVVEPLYLRVYRDSRAITFSNSTSGDLRRVGLRGEISVVPVGIEPVQQSLFEKATSPQFIYVGRLTSSKRIDDIIEAFAIYHRRTGSGTLQLVGDGPRRYVGRLVRLAARLGVSKEVSFCGWLKGPAKHEKMTKAHALLMASVREGWGLVVTECNACGTPAIVYDVPGLRDSVRHMETGIVVKPNPENLARGMFRLLSDPGEYRRLQQNAIDWSHVLNYPASIASVAARLKPDPSDRVEIASRP